MSDINWDTVKAIAVIVVTAAVNVANILGYALDADVWVNAVLSVLSAVAIIYAWWKNNNVTNEAQLAQGVLDELKNEKRSSTEIAQAILTAVSAGYAYWKGENTIDETKLAQAIVLSQMADSADDAEDEGAED